MGDITSSTDSGGKETVYDYDKFRQLTKITGPDGVIAQYEYDKLGRKTKEIDSAGRVHITSYDSPSQISETDANGKTTTREYDAVGRLIKVTYNDGSYHRYFYENYKTTITQPGERYGEIRYGGNDYGEKTYGGLKYGGSGAKYGYDPENNIVKFYDEDNGSLKYIEYPRNKTISY